MGNGDYDSGSRPGPAVGLVVPAPGSAPARVESKDLKGMFEASKPPEPLGCQVYRLTAALEDQVRGILNAWDSPWSFSDENCHVDVSPDVFGGCNLVLDFTASAGGPSAEEVITAVGGLLAELGIAEVVVHDIDVAEVP